MAAKKTEEVVPEGSVLVESVRNLEGFDPFADIPEVATWRDVAPEAIKAAEKAEAKSDAPAKKEN